MFGEFKFAESQFATPGGVKEWKEECKKISLWTKVSKSVILTSRCA